MSLLALGINHKTAPVSVRERVSFSPERLPHALQDLLARPEISEAAILSTCNRTELYCNMETIDTRPIAHWLGGFHEISPDDITPYLYTHPEQDAVRHMLRVASGLDSLVLGEPQVLGQMKTAYQAANDAGTLGTHLNRLFQHTFSVAKQVRTDTAIGASAVSVAFAAVSLAKQIFGDIKNNTALLIGAGETIELAARHLHEQGVGRIIVANRTVERAHALAEQFNGYAIALNELPSHLAEADMVISSTGSQLPILGKGAVERALKARKHRPMFMVDIAVPRDIEPEVGDLDDIYLYTVDDLHEVIEENLKSRREAAEQAEEIIDTQVHRFMEWLRAQKSNRIIRQYRGQAEIIQAEVHAKAMSMLESGKSPEQALDFLSRTLTNKLIHAPTCAMKQAGADGRVELLDAARELLDLEEKKEQ